MYYETAHTSEVGGRETHRKRRRHSPAGTCPVREANSLDSVPPQSPPLVCIAPQIDVLMLSYTGLRTLVRTRALWSEVLQEIECHSSLFLFLCVLATMTFCP